MLYNGFVFNKRNVYKRIFLKMRYFMTSTALPKQGIFLPPSAPSCSIPYTIIKSRRKTWALSLQSDLTLQIRIPLTVTYAEAKQILFTKEKWILKKYRELEQCKNAAPRSSLTPAQRHALEARYRQAARDYFPARVAYYEAIIGVTHGAITIRDQKTRWGSCSAKGNLNFNWRLMLAPPRILDYLVVHELCHRKEMNHSKAFWNAVEMVLPDYKELRKWLKQYGTTLTL